MWWGREMVFLWHEMAIFYALVYENNRHHINWHQMGWIYWIKWGMSPCWTIILMPHLNTLRPRQNGWHFTDNTFKCIFLHENIWVSINISLRFVPKGPINNIPALAQVMAWRRPGGKPLSEPMMVSDAYMRHSSSMSQVTASHLKIRHQGWGEYWTYEYEYWKISTRVVLEYNVFSVFMFIILGKTSTRVVLAPALSGTCRLSLQEPNFLLKKNKKKKQVVET